MRGLLVLALCGCGFSAVKDPNDLAGADLAGADLTPPPGSDLTPPPGADLASPPDLSMNLCAGPLLFITVENLQNPAQTGGKVVVMALGDGSTLPMVCATLTAQGLLDPQPFSVAMVDGKVAVMGRDGVQLIDPSSDTVLWSKPVGNGTDFPVDVFKLQHPDGRKVVAAAWGMGGGNPISIRYVDGYGLDGTLIKSWALNAVDLPLGLSVLGMTTHPKSPTHFIALDPINHQWAWDVDPWSASKTALYGEAIGNPITVFNDIWMSTLRTAWVDAAGQTAVFYVNDTSGSSISGPIKCNTCTFLHVVPDPTTNLRFFGLCDGPGVDTRRVVRFTTNGGTCESVLQGATYGALSRLSRLGIGQ